MKSAVVTLNNSKTTQELTSLFKQGWETYRKNALIYSVYTILSSILMWALSTIPFAASLVFPFYVAGLYTAVKSSEKKNVITLYDFTTFERGNINLIFTTGALSSLLTLSGLILLIVPGVYAFCAYSFITPLALEKSNNNLTSWQILEKSRMMLHQNMKLLVSMTFCYLLLTILALLPFGLGLFISVPLITCINYHLFKKLR